MATVTAQEFVNQMLPYSGGNTSPDAKFVADMVPYAPGGSMEPGSANNPAPDPYARWGGQANYNNLRNNFNDQTNVFRTSVNAAGDQAAQNYKYGIQDFVTGTNAAQQGIDTKNINATMAKNQGARGITAMVGQGIKSGGVMLGNKNAGSSSAVQGIADAYAKLGTQQMQDVNNQFGIAQNQIGLEQQNLTDAAAMQRSRFDDQKNTVVNSLLADAQAKIADINAFAANASLPDRLAAQQEVDRIKAETMGKLQAHDAYLANLKSAQNQDQVRTEAQRLASAGVASTTPFQFTAEAPTSWQGQAPAGGTLPIFTYNRKNNQG